MPQNIWAQTERQIAEELLERGSDRLNKGDVNGAIDDFIRALNADITYSSARKRLRDFQQNPILSVERRMELIRLESLFNNIEELKRSAGYFESKKVVLEENLQDKGKKIDQLTEGLDRIKNSILSSQRGGMDRIHNLEQGQDTESLEQMLELLKETATIEIAILQSQTDYLRKLNQTTTIVKESVEPIRIVEGDVKPFDVSEDIPSSEQIDVLKKQLALSQNKVKALDSYVKERDMKIAKLTNSMVEHSLNASENQLQPKDDVLVEEQNATEDAESRLALGQKLMEEKNTVLQKIQSQYDALKKKNSDKEKEFNEILVSKDEKLIELNGILQIYKEKLAETHKINIDQQANISNLEKELALSQAKIAQQEAMIDETKEDLLSFQRKLIFIQDKLLDLQNYKIAEESSKHNLDKQIGELRTQLKDIDRFLANRLSDFEKSP